MLIRRILRLALVLLLATTLLSTSDLPAGSLHERILAFARPLEFDYVTWILGALGSKIGQSALGADHYLSASQSHQVVLDYLKLVTRIQQAEAHLADIYANPNVPDPALASTLVRQQLRQLAAQRAHLEPLAEAILQKQVASVAADWGLTLGGQPIPPILYQSTPLPTALIVSPRDVIREEDDISLLPGLPVDERAALEDRVDQALNVSSLVEDIGGVGVYPTMVMQTSDLNYLVNTIAHEWTHNFLTLRPLGFKYALDFTNDPQVRTMNETTASISGDEIGGEVIKRYYQEFAPPPAPPQPPPSGSPAPQTPPPFDFRAEMHTTRLAVDAMLKAGQIVQAENYMEQRRVYFWDNGYHIRKLNQAYFAFHGAYAEQPLGAAGADPVGAAVRALRAESPSLAGFIKRIAWMTSYGQLQQAVAQGGGPTNPSK
jgi:hypothetical protein